MTSLQPIEESSLSDSLVRNNEYVIYYKNRKAFISDDNLQLKSTAEAQYNLLSNSTANGITAYELPNANEIDLNCRPDCSMELINYDKDFNSYWHIWDDIKRFDHAPRPAVCIYNRLGQKIKFFMEPLPPKNWHFGYPISVSEDGRIFRMLYHETDGIRIIEYLWREKKK